MPSQKEETICNEPKNLVFEMHISKYRMNSIMKDLIRPSNNHTMINRNLLNY